MAINVDSFTKRLSKKERDEAKEKLLSFRAEGTKEDYSDLSRRLGVDQQALIDIEQSPQYIDNLIKKIVLKNSSRIGNIVESLFAAAEGGSIKHIDTLIKLLGVSKETLRIEEVKVDDEDRDYTDAEMAERIKELT